MALQVSKKNPSAERSVVVGAIGDSRVLSALVDLWSPGKLPSPYSNRVVGWCVEHWKRYGKAPGGQIRTYFEEWAVRDEQNPDVVLISNLLAQLSDENTRQKEELQADVVIDHAVRLFRRTGLVELRDHLTRALDANDVDAAVELAQKFKAADRETHLTTDYSADTDAVKEAFARINEPPLVEFGGAFDQFFGNAFARGKFTCFLAPAKRGKSFILQDVAVRAAESGLRVAYFEAGDHTRPELTERLMAKWAGRPLKAGTYHVPVSIDTPPPGKRTPFRVETESKTFRRDLDESDVETFRREWVEKHKIAPLSFRTQYYSNSSLTIRHVRRQLERWDREGSPVDVCILDYMGILNFPDTKLDMRDRINESWKQARALSQDLNCLFVTATQAKIEGADTWLLRRKHFSEDSRQYQHVTHMIGYNRTDAEQAEQAFRLNWLAGRDIKFREDQCLWCAGNLDYCNPFGVAAF